MTDLHDTIAAAMAEHILACLKETEGDPKARDDESVADEVACDIAAGIIDAFDIDMVEELLVHLISKSDIWDRKEIADMFARLNGDV